MNKILLAIVLTLCSVQGLLGEKTAYVYLISEDPRLGKRILLKKTLTSATGFLSFFGLSSPQEIYFPIIVSCDDKMDMFQCIKTANSDLTNPIFTEKINQNISAYFFKTPDFQVDNVQFKWYSVNPFMAQKWAQTVKGNEIPEKIWDYLNGKLKSVIDTFSSATMNTLSAAPATAQALVSSLTTLKDKLTALTAKL